jgi:lipopolysaccharide export system protein LptA
MTGGRDERRIVKDSIQRHIRGKRWIKILAVAGFVITTGIIAGTYWQGKTSRPKTLPKPPELPRNVNQQLSGFTFTRSDKGRQLFVIHASRTLAFKQGGSALLKDVYVEFFGRTGKRYDLLTTQEGEYNPSTGNLSTPGDVELILNASPSQIKDLASKPGKPINERPADADAGRQPVYIKTSKVTSHDHGTQLESMTPVRFNLGDVSGSARGLAYGTGRGEIELKQDVEAVFRPAQGSQIGSPIQLSASRLRYAGPGEGVQLWGPVRIRQGRRTVTAKQGSILLDAKNRVTGVLLEGKVHASDPTKDGQLSLRSDVLRSHLDPATSRLSKLVAAGHVRTESSRGGALTNVEAHEVVLNFDPATHVPAHGVAMGNVHLTIAQTQGPQKASSGSQTLGGKISKENLATEKILFSFRPKGKNLSEAETSGPGTLVLYPEDPKAGDRTVTAARFFMAFDSTSHLESLRGTGGTKIVFAPPPNSSNPTAAVATASQLVASFDPATEMIRSVDQKGEFHFRKGTLEATGEEAQDLAVEQKLTLTGHPKVWDSTTRARADRIEILLASDVAEGIGSVHAIHIDPQDPSSPPTNVAAARMIADHRSQMVHYEGHVRAWRGTDVVESPSLDVYRNERRVSTNSRVVTSHLQPAPSKTGQKKGSDSGPSPLTVRADRLDYFDVGRRARYSGNVELDTEDTKIEADRLDVYFSSGKDQTDSEVERAVAEGHVKIVQPMRFAKGENAVYDARNGMVVMTGGPPTVYDTEKGSMSGQRLTFYIHNDRLLVDGNANSPAVSKHRVAQ